MQRHSNCRIVPWTYDYVRVAIQKSNATYYTLKYTLLVH